MKEKEYKPERVTFMSSQDLIEAIEDYQHDNRIQNRSEAIRQLVEFALECKGNK